MLRKVSENLRTGYYRKLNEGWGKENSPLYFTQTKTKQMKVEVKEINKHEGVKYPCLMVNGNLIVLFTSRSSGTVVSKNSMWSLGHHCNSWSMDVFKPFHGSITLSND